MLLQRVLFLSLFSVSLVFINGQVSAQHQPDKHNHRVMQEIDAAFHEGGITLDQKVLYKFYAGLKREKLPSQFKTDAGKIVKCGTPAQIDFKKYKDRLAASTLNEIESLTSGTASTLAQETYQSPSGKFMLHYETSGADAVPPEDTNGNGVPDYVEQAAAAADSSWRHQVATLDYTDPILPSGPYDVYFKNFGFYGQTVSSGNTTYIEIHNTFENFPPNTDPEGNVIGAIKATMAHEFKHAIQYAATQWSGESDLWAEMDATLMEEVVYDNVNDYYNYLTNSSSLFENPQNSFYPGSYYHVTWALYFEQNIGPDFWPNVWERIKANPNSINFTEAMQDELGGAENFQENYVESHLWHLASGDLFTLNGYGFEESSKYPNATMREGSRFITNDFSIPRDQPNSLENFSAAYHRITPSSFLTGKVVYEIILSEYSAIGLIISFNDGSFDTKTFATSESKEAKLIETNWNWEDINFIGFVFANPNIQRSVISPSIIFGATRPEEFVLSQNYPNPFNPTTDIRFSLTEEASVKLKVFDITGRMIKTLIDETLPAGNYQQTFNGSNLASGVYFYQLVTDQKVLSRKMTLIK